MFYPYMSQQVNRASRKIIVIGNGEVAVEPNIATVQLEVVTVNEQLSEAQQENAVAMNNVIQSLLGLGVPRENIQTVSYTIFPRYDYVDGKQFSTPRFIIYISEIWYTRPFFFFSEEHLSLIAIR